MVVGACAGLKKEGIALFCSAEAAKHLSAERFLADFVVVRRSNVITLQAAMRQKLQKYYAERLMCTALFGYTDAVLRCRLDLAVSAHFF